MATTQSSVSRAPRPSSLADVLDLILDKGLVIDAYVRISALGIEVLTIDARIVIASVDTYLHFAEAVNRLDLSQTETQGIQGLTQGLSESGAKGKVRGALEGGKEAITGRGNGSGDRQESRSRRGS
ncbi:MAG: gas vesicle structural protein GvpA [Actinomycetota bacterium]|nr:gas vesicle structural protein GvpA [Actinomycetota bacterium]